MRCRTRWGRTTPTGWPGSITPSWNTSRHLDLAAFSAPSRRRSPCHGWRRPVRGHRAGAGTPSPAVTPTNLLYNVISTPGALYRYWRQGQTGGRLALVLIAGTLPGVIAGSFIRVKLIPGPRVFNVMVAAVLIPLGTWLVLSRPARTDQPD